MADYDWSQFIVRIPVAAPPDKLYRAWATRNGIEHWFLRMSEYKMPDGTLRKADEEVHDGDTYAWLWHGWPDEVIERGKILSCNGKDSFKFTFGEAGNCAVQLSAESNFTMVEIHQTDIPTDEHGKQYWHVGCKTGWTFHLTNMKSIFEGGADLRNKDASVKNVINA